MALQTWNLMRLRVFFDGQSNRSRLPGWRRCCMSIGTIILIILVIALLGGFSGFGGGPFYGTGYYGGGGLGLVIVILLILLLLGKL
jgi:Na+/melibiose symporter-like transporter